MPSWNDRGLRIVEAAVADAISQAQWERLHLETQLPGQEFDDRLHVKAAELAMSPIARDQLMSVALAHGAFRCRPKQPLIDVDCCSGERIAIIDRVVALGPHKASKTRAAVALIEKRHARRLGHDARFDLLSECLRQDAVLQEELWNHPAIPATDSVRLTMLCSVPQLRQRADDLSLSGGVCWRGAAGWCRSILKRDAP